MTPLNAPKLTVAVVALLGLLALRPGTAQAVSLADLLMPGASITFGDKIAENWEVNIDFAGLTEFIEVVALNDPPLNPGLKFTLNGQLTNPLDTLGPFEDVLFFAGSFDVTVQNPALLIVDNSLEVTAFEFEKVNACSPCAPTPTNGLSIKIVETIFTDATEEFQLGEKIVFLDPYNGQTFAEAEFDPQTSIHVHKDIFITNLYPEDWYVELAMLEQRYSQVAVPEPGSLTLFGIGLAGLAAWRWKQARTANS